MTPNKIRVEKGESFRALLKDKIYRWGCYQCGEKSTPFEKKYYKFIVPDGKNEPRKVLIYVHCHNLNKKGW